LLPSGGTPSVSVGIGSKVGQPIKISLTRRQLKSQQRHKPGTLATYSADHVRAEGDGGTNERANCRATHATCNSSRGGGSFLGRRPPAPGSQRNAKRRTGRHEHWREPRSPGPLPSNTSRPRNRPSFDRLRSRWRRVSAAASARSTRRRADVLFALDDVWPAELRGWSRVHP
jgi:hypothetical protein